MNTINKYIDNDTLSKDKIIIGDYENLLLELNRYLYNKNSREFLLCPNDSDFKILKLINVLTQLEADPSIFCKHLNITNQDIKKNGYALRKITTLFSNYVENFFFDDEFKQPQYTYNNLKSEYLVETNWGGNDKLIIKRNNNDKNNPQSKYDIDGKIDNTNIYIDIKGRYDKRKTLITTEVDDSFYLDDKTLLKYYCRKVHDNADIWFAIYHNYGPGDYGINFVSFNTLLLYLDIRLNKTLASQLPTTQDLLNNKFNNIPLTIEINHNMNKAHKILNPHASDIIEITKFNNTSFINFNYKLLSCSKRNFINVLSQ